MYCTVSGTSFNYLYSAKFCLVQNFERNLLVLGNISLSVSLEVLKIDMFIVGFQIDDCVEWPQFCEFEMLTGATSNL